MVPYVIGLPQTDFDGTLGCLAVLGLQRNERRRRLWARPSIRDKSPDGEGWPAGVRSEKVGLDLGRQLVFSVTHWAISEARVADPACFRETVRTSVAQASGWCRVKEVGVQVTENGFDILLESVSGLVAGVTML